MIEELARLAAPLGELLKERRQKIAVADGATGGLISAALLTVPGATRFYRGGGVVYSLKGRDILLNLPAADLVGMTSVTEAYALLQAKAIRDNFGAHWGVAESGSAGPAHPRGVAAGRSCIAVAGPGVALVRSVDTDRDDRIGNMEAFTIAALGLLKEALDA